MTLAQQIDLSRTSDITPDGSDYETVRQVIEMLTLDYQSQPSLELIAERDDDGQMLDGHCRYRLSGTTPPARGWTIGITDGEGLPFRLAIERRSFTDSEIVRPEDGRMLIVAAATPEAGNWLPLPASGRFQIRLRLYDTPISTQTGETRATNLPRIARLDCR